MDETIKKLNKLIEKLDKNIQFIKSGAIIDNSGMSPLKIKWVRYYKEQNMYIIMTEQLDDYLCIDVESLDKAMAKKESI